MELQRAVTGIIPNNLAPFSGRQQAWAQGDGPRCTYALCPALFQNNMGHFSRQRSSNFPTDIPPTPWYYCLNKKVNTMHNKKCIITSSGNGYNPQRPSICLTVQMSFSGCSKPGTGQLLWKRKEGYQSKGNGCSEENFNIDYLLMPGVILSAVAVFKQIAYVMDIKTQQWNQHSVSLKRTVPFVAT